jgi:RHS repeat-associated protein
VVSDGRWNYSWDAEKRLVRVMSWGSVDRRRVHWTYDALGRRVRQVRYVWTNGTWQVVEDLKLVSDPVLFGRHIAELNGTNGAVVRSYVWGLDVSETLDGAGGVGGLLWVRLSGGPAAGVHFVTYDGNGNVWTLVSASTGTETARYEYGPFGEPLRLTGAAAGWNPFRFSTKRTEDGTGLVLYEYRAYSPALGRWLSRDPVGEVGFEGKQHVTFTKEDVQYLNTLDPEDDLDAVETAQHNIVYAVINVAYLMVNNDPVGKGDLYGLVCNVVVNRTKAISSCGINAGHEWIVYDGKSVGFWPNRGYVVSRPDPAAEAGAPIYWQWETEQKKTGKIKWGPAAGKPCACATCGDILASIDAAPHPGWHSFPIRNNCRQFVTWVLDGSCLKKGKKTSFTP